MKKIIRENITSKFLAKNKFFVALKVQLTLFDSFKKPQTVFSRIIA